MDNSTAEECLSESQNFCNRPLLPLLSSHLLDTYTRTMASIMKLEKKPKPDSKPANEFEAFQLLKKIGNLKHLIGKDIPYHPWTGLKYPVIVELSGFVDVMQEVNDEWIRYKMPSNRINQMNTIKMGIIQMMKQDPSITTYTFRFKDTIRAFMEFAIFALLGELNFDYAPYTRNEDIMYGMINAWTRRKDWPIPCSAAVMILYHHSYDWGKLNRTEYSNLHHQTWMRKECWLEWKTKEVKAEYPVRRGIEDIEQVRMLQGSKLEKTESIDDTPMSKKGANDETIRTKKIMLSSNSNSKNRDHKTGFKLATKTQFKKKAKQTQNVKVQGEYPICKYFKKK